MRLMMQQVVAWMMVVCMAGLVSCSKKQEEQDPQASAPSPPEAAAPAVAERPVAPLARSQQPAEPNSFDQVARHLEPGGNFYLYMSTEQATAKAIGQLRSLQENLLGTLQTVDPANAQKVQVYGDLLIKAMDESGLSQISGLGMSSFATAPQTYRNKLVVHHYPGQGDGKLWQMLGNQPHELDSLKLMPADTVLATYMDFDLQLLWQWFNDLSASAQAPELQMGLQQVRQIMTMQQLPPDQLFASLGKGGMGFALTMSRTEQISIPIDPATPPLELPTPAMMIFLKTQNDMLYDYLTSRLQEQGAPLKTEETDGFRLASMEVPARLPVPLLPTLAAGRGYLIIASHADLVKEAITAHSQGSGLIGTDEFASVSANVPQTGNQWHFASQRLADIVGDLQDNLVTHKLPPDQKAQLEKLMDQWQTHMPWSYGVLQVNDEGMMMTANSNANIGKVMMIQGTVVPAAVIAGMALPVLSKARVKARRVNSAGNMKQLGLGLLMYSGDHNGDFPAEDGADGLNKLVADNYIQAGKVFVNPREEHRQAPTGSTVTPETTSYLYLGGWRDDNANATLTPILFEKPHGDDWCNVLFIDGHVEGFQGDFDSLSDVVETLLMRGRYPEKVAADLRAKAAEMDRNRHQHGY